MKKTCSQCKKSKSLDNFSLASDKASGKKSICKTCHSLRMKEYRKRAKESDPLYSEKQRERSRILREKQKERDEIERNINPLYVSKSKQYQHNYRNKYKEELIERNKEWRSNNVEHAKNYRRHRTVHKYGITSEQYEQMLIDQDFSCAICGTHQSKLKVSLAIDHCHETGRVRGLLCSACNLGLGMFKDSTSSLQKAINYLES